jgi:hypothetical protein
MSNPKMIKPSKRFRESDDQGELEPGTNHDEKSSEFSAEQFKTSAASIDTTDEVSAKKVKVGSTEPEFRDEDNEVTVVYVKRATGMLDLPDELLVMIGQFLNLEDMSNFCKVNKRIYKAINTHDGSWKKFFKEFRLTRSDFIDKTAAGNSL